jgi:hypothetical protein
VGRDPQSAENKKHNWENTIFLTDRRQVESGTRHSHTTCGTQVKKHLRPPSHPAMDQRLLLKSPLAKNNKYFATALPCLAGHACGDCRKTYPIPIIPLSTYLSCQVVSTSLKKMYVLYALSLPLHAKNQEPRTTSNKISDRYEMEWKQVV